MKAGWEVKPLGEVCQKSSTIDPRKLPELEFDYVDVSSVSNETFQIAETQRLLGADAPSRARRQIRSKDILFATIRPTLKRIAQVPESLDGQVCSTGYIVLRPKEELDPRYLMHSLFRPDFLDAMESLQSGASYPAVTDKQVRSQPIPLPPLEEQQRIVAVLDEAFDGLARARAHAKANLQNARELFEVRRAAIFSDDAEDETVPLGEVCTKFEYGTASKSQPEGKVPVLRMGNLQDGEIDWSDLVYSSDEQECSRYLLREGDVLFNRTNSPAHVGKTSIFDGKMPAIFAGYLIRVTPDTKRLTPQFLTHFLNSDIARAYGRTVMGTSVNQANISGGKLKKYLIRLPSLEQQAEQTELLDTLKEAVKPLQQKYARRLQDIDNLRQSLLQKAFAGELT